MSRGTLNLAQPINQPTYTLHKAIYLLRSTSIFIPVRGAA